ncbi:hypothetical protein V7134_25805, partial [Priestia megaterium]|uniref:hypothetical protein n=1 Tax=Priestia megaterium TaxID=1404 RepID=UPI00300076AA
MNFINIQTIVSDHLTPMCYVCNSIVLAASKKITDKGRLFLHFKEAFQLRIPCFSFILLILNDIRN